MIVDPECPFCEAQAAWVDDVFRTPHVFVPARFGKCTNCDTSWLPSEEEARVDAVLVIKYRQLYDELRLMLDCCEDQNAKLTAVANEMDARVEAAEAVCRAAGKYREAFRGGAIDGEFPMSIRFSGAEAARNELEAKWQAWSKGRTKSCGWRLPMWSLVFSTPSILC